MQQSTFDGLDKKDFRGAEVPGTPLNAEYEAFVNQYRNLYNLGITTYDVVIGPVAKEVFLPPVWVANPALPPQFKFESVDACMSLEPVAVIPPVEPFTAL